MLNILFSKAMDRLINCGHVRIVLAVVDVAALTAKSGETNKADAGQCDQ